MLNQLTHRIKKFAESTKGTVAMITALTTPVMILAAGFSLDYGLAINADKELKAAADAAALGALNEARVAYLNEENVDLKELVEKTTKDIFLSRAKKFKFLDVQSIQIEPSIVNNVFKNNLTYTAKYKTQLMKYSGFDTVDVSNASNATVTTTSYININFIFDISASMGIGASDEDIRIMNDVISCAFACHIGANPNTTSYTIAHNAGAVLRIDVARNAAIDAIRQIERNMSVDNQVTFGVTTFHNTIDTVLAPDDRRAGDFNYVTSRINDAVHLTSEGGGTNIQTAVDTVARNLPPSGTGLTPDNRIQYVIVLTDGIEDRRKFFRDGSHTTDTTQSLNRPYYDNVYGIATGECSILKDKDINTYFIYTEYLTPQLGLRDNHIRDVFRFIENNLYDVLPTRFKDCTGDEKRVVKTSTPREIQTAFDDIVGSITSPLRLY